MDRIGIALLAVCLLLAGCSGLGGDTGTAGMPENKSAGEAPDGQTEADETGPRTDNNGNESEPSNSENDQEEQKDDETGNDSETLSDRQRGLAVGIENLAAQVEAEFDNRSLVTTNKSVNTSASAISNESIVRPDGSNEMALGITVTDGQPAPEVVAQLTHSIAMAIFHEPAVLATDAGNPREELVIPDRYTIVVYDGTGTRIETVSFRDRLLAAYLNSGYLDNELKDAVRNNSARQQLADETVVPVLNATNEDISAGYPANATGITEAGLTYFRAAELGTFVDAFETEYRWALNTTVETVQIDLEYEEVQVLAKVDGLFEEVDAPSTPYVLASNILIDLPQPNPPKKSPGFEMQPPVNMPKNGIHVYSDLKKYNWTGDRRTLIPTIQVLEATQNIILTGDQATYRSQINFQVDQKYTKQLKIGGGTSGPFRERYLPFRPNPD